jgi:hypothetical protein
VLPLGETATVAALFIHKQPTPGLSRSHHQRRVILRVDVYAHRSVEGTDYFLNSSAIDADALAVMAPPGRAVADCGCA